MTRTRYDQLKPEELKDDQFSAYMGKLLGHAMVNPKHAMIVAAAGRTLASAARDMALREGTDIKQWDKDVRSQAEYMADKAVVIVEDEGDRPPEPENILDAKRVTEQELAQTVQVFGAAMAVFMTFGTAGAVPNVIAGALIKGIEMNLKSAAGRNGMDVVDWHRQVDNAMDRVMENVETFVAPPGTVVQKGGDA